MSFDAYTVAVKLTLVNGVSAGLSLISRHFAKAEGDVKSYQKRLEEINKLMLFGGAALGSGAFGLGLIAKAIKPAEEYTHQLNIMNMAGMKQKDIADSVGSAWKLAGENLTTTATGNLKMLLDLRNVTGSLQEAKTFLPIMAQMQTVLAASKEGEVSANSGDLAFSAMKALDIRGAVNDPEVLKRQADLMTRVIIGTQGRVTPAQFQSVFNYARQAKFALSDDFAYKYLPTLMLENATKGGGGGGSKGVGPALAALYRFTNQGFVNKKSLPLLKELGVLGNGSILPTSTAGTMVAPLIDSKLAASNSFDWLTTDVLPKISTYLARHQMADNQENVLSVINLMTRGNQLAGSLLGEFYVKQKNFERDRKLFEGVMSPDSAYKASMSNDPDTAMRALSAQWTNFKTSLMVNIAPLVVPALISLSQNLNSLGNWARNHPNMTKDLVLGFGALSAAMAFGGTVSLLTAAFKGLGLALGFSGLGGGAAGIRGIAAAIGTAGTGGTLLFGLAALGLAVGGMAYVLTKVAGVGHPDDEKSHPGQKWYITGHGGYWGFDPNKSQEHAGQVWVHGTRGMAGHYENSDGSNINTIRPAKSMMVTLSQPIYLDGKKIAESVTQHQTKAASRPASGLTSFDASQMQMHPNFNIGNN